MSVQAISSTPIVVRDLLERNSSDTTRSLRRERTAGANTAHLPDDDFSRSVYCVMGVPIDAIDLDAALDKISEAVDTRKPFLLSTVNLNFIANALAELDFRNSLLSSSLCTADGMPVVVVARILGLPIGGRVTGSDLFDQLTMGRRQKRKLSVYLLGGAENAAEVACKKINSSAVGLMMCAGHCNPGHGSVSEMSDPRLIRAINESGADLLCVALGAGKGQAWLLQNHENLAVPVRAHLGAALNFQAGTIRRAPKSWQRFGLEWLWRIREEPRLCRRYRNDGLLLARLVVSNLLPLAATNAWHRFKQLDRASAFGIESVTDLGYTIEISGHAVSDHVETAARHFREAMHSVSEVITLDLSRTRHIDARFLGLLMMLAKQAQMRGKKFVIVGTTRYVRRLFRFHAAGFLLSKS